MLVRSKNILLYPSSFSNWAAVQAGGTRYTGLQPPQLEQAKRGSKHRFPSLVGEDITQHKELLKHPSNSLSVYTDGGGIDNNVRAATKCTKLAHIEDSETSTVYAAELQGIRLALQI